MYGYPMIKDFTAADVPDLSGKSIFISGANTGIGFAAARVFAGKGGRVLLGCRDPEKGRLAMNRIYRSHPGADLKFVPLDLADLASVRVAAEIVLKESKLDVLVNNAGVMWTPKMHTKDGFEYQIGINHLGHFALTGLLLGLLDETPNSRIVTVSSLGHRKCVGGSLLLDDVQAENSYDPGYRYSVSKLANLLFTYELDRRLRARGSSTVAVAVHPGVSRTELFRHAGGVSGFILKSAAALARPFINTTEKGAWPTLLGATAPGVAGGQYFGPGKFGEISGPAKQVDSSPDSKDLDKAAELWRFSIEMTGVDPAI